MPALIIGIYSTPQHVRLPVMSLQGLIVMSASFCNPPTGTLHATQLFLKKCGRGGELMATLSPVSDFRIFLARDSNLKLLDPKTNEFLLLIAVATPTHFLGLFSKSETYHSLVSGEQF